MRIAAVTTRILTDGGLPQLFVDIESEDGLVGIGECWWGVPNPGRLTVSDAGRDAGPHLKPIASAVDDLFAQFLRGAPADNIAALRQEMVHFAYRYGIGGILSAALSGIDLALWDLKGKRLGVPAIDLLGGPVRAGLRAYASLPPLREPDLLQSEVRRAVSMGFTGVKLHELTVEHMRLAREAAGPDIAIMVDVNGHFTVLEAVELARGLADHDVYWFEEPTWPMRDHRAMAKVRAETGVCLAAGENELGLAGLDALMRSGAADVIMPEIAKIGGLTVLRQVGALAALHNLPLSPHSFRSGPAMYANVHFALSCPQADWVETPFLPEVLNFAGGIPLPPIEDGLIKLPPGPGLGLPA